MSVLKTCMNRFQRCHCVKRKKNIGFINNDLMKREATRMNNEY